MSKTYSSTDRLVEIAAIASVILAMFVVSPLSAQEIVVLDNDPAAVDGEYDLGNPDGEDATLAMTNHTGISQVYPPPDNFYGVDADITCGMKVDIDIDANHPHQMTYYYAKFFIVPDPEPMGVPNVKSGGVFMRIERGVDQIKIIEGVWTDASPAGSYKIRAFLYRYTGDPDDEEERADIDNYRFIQRLTGSTFGVVP